MPDSNNRRDALEELLQQADALETRFKTWQNESAPDLAEIRSGERAYLEWFEKARTLVPDDETDRFIDMYEGGSVIKRIRSFLQGPTDQSPFYQADQPNPLMPKWRHPFETAVQPSLGVQREILTRTLTAAPAIVPALEELAEHFRRFPQFIETLERADNPNVPAPRISRESELQVLVLAMLRMMYDDVRPEDYVSQHAGGSSRIDFLLREVGIVVETKMTRATLNDRKVGEELLIDWGRYAKHPDCKAIFALVYDPSRQLTNPAGLEHDLSQSENSPITQVVVVR